MKKLFVVLALLASICHGQTIEFVVKSSPGGPDDTITRKIVEHLEKTTSLDFVVMNKPGAAHLIGYTHFENNVGPSLIIADANIQLHPVYHKSENLFTLGEFTNILFVRNGSGIEHVNDLYEISSKREIKFGHGGEGTFSHTAAVKLCEQGLRCLYVPYKSGAPGMIDLMSGTIDAFAIASYGSTHHLSNNKLKAIMLYSNTKHPKMDVSLLPNNLKKIEIRNSIMIYSRNLSEKQTKEIKKSLSSLDKDFLIESGLWVK